MSQALLPGVNKAKCSSIPSFCIIRNRIYLLGLVEWRCGGVYKCGKAINNAVLKQTCCILLLWSAASVPFELFVFQTVKLL